MGEALDVPQIGCVRHPMHLQQKKKISDGSDDITAGSDVAEFRLLISPKPYKPTICIISLFFACVLCVTN